MGCSRSRLHDVVGPRGAIVCLELDGGKVAERREERVSTSQGVEFAASPGRFNRPGKPGAVQPRAGATGRRRDEQRPRLTSPPPPPAAPIPIFAARPDTAPSPHGSSATAPD